MTTRRCLIIDHDAKHLDSLRRLFSAFDPVVVSFRDFSSSFASSFDFIVLSGGPIHISSPFDLVEEKRFLRETSIPVFAVCLGLELLGVAFGASLRPLSGSHHSVDSCSFAGVRGRLRYAHGWCLWDAPSSFFVLRRHPWGFVAVMRHINRPLFAVQGHPELSGRFGRFLRDYFLYVVAGFSSRALFSSFKQRERCIRKG